MIKLCQLSCEVPALSCSRGKLIITIGPAWLPVNNMTHKAIRHLPADSPFPPCCLQLAPGLSHPCTATPPAWPPASSPSAAHLFRSRSPLNDRTAAPKCVFFFFWSGGEGRSAGEFLQKESARQTQFMLAALCSAVSLLWKLLVLFAVKKWTR